jgi:dTDP-4-amino-4,6-dideoxygalactose transaminase
MKAKIPFLKPAPARLSLAEDHLREIEESGLYSNFGPTNAAFESRLITEIFGGVGACATVCNATIGLMLAIKAAVMDDEPSRRRRYALMPSYTFAATAHAALWSGLTPIFCDVDPQTWLPCLESERRILEKFGDEIAVVVPYATFGADLDLDRYQSWAERFGVSVVVDAAASLGTLDRHGRGFGAGFPFPVVFSMHVTKTFAATEGGLIYASNPELIAKLRAMSNFGFGEPRTATMLGLNGKLSEIAALAALLKLDGFDRIVERRAALYRRYRERLAQFDFQAPTAKRQAHQFVPLLLPERADAQAVSRHLTEAGIGHASYFRPHLGEQPYFQRVCQLLSTPVADRLSGRSLSLPLHDAMLEDEVNFVCDVLIRAVF